MVQQMALSVQNVQGNALGAFAAGQQQAAEMKNQQLEHAKQNFGYLAQLASDAQGDPAAWDAGLQALEASGWPPEQLAQFKGRADLAPILAKSALTAQQELDNNYNQAQLDMSRRRFALEMAQAAQGPAPTANMRDFQFSQENTGFAEFLNPTKPPAAPSGYTYAADGQTLQPIPGGPADKPSTAPAAPSGYQYAADGQTLQFIPGGPADPSSKPERSDFTVSQATAAGYVDRMAQADAIIADPRLASASAATTPCCSPMTAGPRENAQKSTWPTFAPP